MVGRTTPSQAWSILNRHARDDIAPLRLKDLCTDNDRTTSLVTVHSINPNARARILESSSKSGGGGDTSKTAFATTALSNHRILIADLSRQRMTLETLNYLFRLATAVDLRGFILTLAWGQNDRMDPVSNQRDDGDRDSQNGGHGASSASSSRRQKHFFGDQYDDSHGANSSSVNSSHHPTHGKNSETLATGRTIYHSQYQSHPSQPYQQQQQHPASPGRSIATANSHVKKTRFAQNNAHSNSSSSNYYNNQPQSLGDDASTVATSSVISNQQQQLLSPSPSNHMSPTNHKVPLQTSPSMHMALRAPSHCHLQMMTAHGTNALDEIHAQWKRIQSVSSSIRKGQMKGINGHTLKNILVIGRGVAFAGVQFMFHALKNDEQGYNGLCAGLSDRKMSVMKCYDCRNMRFLSTMDPVALHSTLSDWNPEQTCIVSIIMNEEENDLLRLTETVKQWLFTGLKINSKREIVVNGKHVFFITGSDELYNSQVITKAECSFLIPSFARCEAFTTTSVAGLFPLSIAFGWDVVQDILNGAHDLDTHFVESSPRHNIPVLLALVDLWNDFFLPASCSYKPCGGKIITPFMESFTSYPSFVATLEAQVCGRGNLGGRNRNPYSHVSPSGIVIDGGINGSLDRVMYQGRRSPPCEMIVAMEPQLPPRRIDKDMMRFYRESIYGDDAKSSQDRSICTFFAHADVMAFGSGGYRDSLERGGGSVHTGGGSHSFFGHGLGSTSFDSNVIPTTPQQSVTQDHDVAHGNRPSSLLICSRCDAFAIGQLVALAEHRALISSKLWDVEHYAFTPLHGSSIRSKQVENMTEKLELLYQRLDLVGNVNEDDETDPVGGPNLNLATTTLLGHYATQMHQNKKRFGCAER